MDDWKMDFKMKTMCEDYFGAVKILSKIRMSKKYEHLSRLDKINLNYCLGWSFEKIKDNNMADFYASESIKLASEDKERYLGGYCRGIWLKTNSNKGSMKKADFIFKMKELSNLYLEMKDYDNSHLAICNIYSFLNNGQGLFDYFFKVRDSFSNVEYAENNVLVDLKKINQELYIKAVKRIENIKLRVIK